MEKVVPIARARRAAKNASTERLLHSVSTADFASCKENINPVETLVLVSVVVPTCGRVELLDRCIEALTVQNFPVAQIEIFIVDDAPTAATRDLLIDWAVRISGTGLKLNYIANHGVHGPAAARNRGWRAARAAIVAFTDDDTVPDRNWLKHGVAAFATGADVVCGRVAMPISAVPTDYEADARQLETAEFVTANCLCRKDVLEALGGFDERFRLAWREDSDFHFRLLQSGARISHAGDALVVHPVRAAPWGVSVSQQKKILFDALLYKKHPRLYRERIRGSPRWDYYLTVALLLLAATGLILGSTNMFVPAVVGWLIMTGWFCIKRLRGKAMTWSHVAEMIWTSVLIPPVAVFWRLVGVFKFRVGFV